MKQYDESVVERIKAEIIDKKESSESSNGAPDETVSGALYEALMKQLEVLNEQIKEKDHQISELHRMLDQEQQLNALNYKKIELLEQKNEEGLSEERQQRKSWWKFWKY